MGHRPILFLSVREDAISILKASDIVVMSSNFEGFGLAAVEGMAAGKPVIASDVEGLSNIVEGAGLLFEPHNEKDLAAKIRLLMKINYSIKVFLKNVNNGVKNMMYPLWGIVTINCINPCVDEY